MTSGASCPDALVEGIINKLKHIFKVVKPSEDILAVWE
jgi:4-hydroxy-3-methylbut-2-enyl diphosphate reductase IspH